MAKKWFLIIAVFAVLAAVYSQGGAAKPLSPVSANETAVKTAVNETATELKTTESLPLVGSYANLKKLLKEAEPFFSYGRIGMGATSDFAVTEGNQFAKAKEAPTASSAPAPAPVFEDFSRTNIQVQGVDEADIVKTDGQYIYQVNRGRIVIARVYPPEQMEVCSTVTFNDRNFNPQEIYVDEKHLVVIGTSGREIPFKERPSIVEPPGAETSRSVKPTLTETTGLEISASQSSIKAPGIEVSTPPIEVRSKEPPGIEAPRMEIPKFRNEDNIIIYPPPYYFHSTVKMVVFDISNRKDAKQLREVELEGNYISSRKIGSSIYLAANKNIDYYYIMKAEENIKETAENPTPSYRDTASGGEFKNIGYSQIRYFPGFTRPNYLLVAGLDLNRPEEEVEVQTFLGAGDNIYASTQNLYVSVTGYGKAVNVIPPADPGTCIYKFALDGGKTNYIARGEVPGTVLNQFSMDEHSGHFRLATTSGNPWAGGDDTSRNNIYILDEELNLKGKIENIAPGEKIYSVRFMGDRGYMVTFRTMDPLFAIDLKDPENPRVLGALKIPGYSDYLHPYDENHIIGFGKDTMEIVHKDSAGRTISTNAIDLGMKIALFDVSDVYNPVEKYKEIIGGRGTTSDLLQNHRALLFSKEKNLLAFPVTVMESRDVNIGGVPSYGEFTFQGAYVYHLSLSEGFKLKGKISHLTGEEYLKAGRYGYDHHKNVERIVYIGDILYTLSPSIFKANNLGDLKEIKALMIPGI